MKMSPFKKIIQWLCANEIASEVKKAEKRVRKQCAEAFSKEKLHTAHLRAHTIREPSQLYLAMICPCGEKLCGTFVRKAGFNFTCSECGAKIVGGISEFADVAENALGGAS